MESEQNIDFDWVEENVIGATSYPSEVSYKFLKNLGIKIIFNLTKHPVQSKILPDFIYHHIPIKDFSVPTEQQVRRFLDLTEKYQHENKPMVVHCIAGCGRTGQMLAIWGIEMGIITNNDDPVTWIRSKRKCAVETLEQQIFVRKWKKRIDTE